MMLEGHWSFGDYCPQGATLWAFHRRTNIVAVTFTHSSNVGMTAGGTSPWQKPGFSFFLGWLLNMWHAIMILKPTTEANCI